MTQGRYHIVGAGLAGLSAAIRLRQLGREVIIYESSGQAGGRCRSLFDKSLDRLIDNGNHLIMAGNRATFAYLDVIGARHEMVPIKPAAFPFVDLSTGERWTVRPNGGRLPWWPLSKSRRVAGTRSGDYLIGTRLISAKPTDTVLSLLGDKEMLYRRLWDPLATAALNTAPDEGAAHLLWPVMAETFLKGEAFCRPYIADKGLGPALVDPAVNWLQDHKVTIRFSTRVKSIYFIKNMAQAIEIKPENQTLNPEDKIIVCTPPAATGDLIDGIRVPDQSRAIVNVHFRLDKPVRMPGGHRVLGVVGATAQWIFARDDMVSVTVSAADALAALDNDDIAKRIWSDVEAALSLPAASDVPRYRVINEKRATMAQTPEQVALRPDTKTQYDNVFLAGDWTNTGLPATIESAILSGTMAAEQAALPGK